MLAERTDALDMNTPIRLTGNPFVDTGLAVIAARSGKDSANQLNLGDLHSIHNNGEWLARDVHSLKSFTMIFTRNALLTQHRRNDSAMIEQRIKMHAAITSELLRSIGKETEDERCQSCGNAKSLDLSFAVNHALSPFGETPKERFVGRDWFPLAGSLGSDAQSLPAASRAVALCAKCLFAVQYLPLGVQLFGNELVVFQSTSEDLWYSMVRQIALLEQRRVADGKFEVIGSKEGRESLVFQLLRTFKDMRFYKGRHALDEHTVLYAWRFTNSTSPDLEIESIPSFALEFLWRVSFKEGLEKEIERILRNDRRRSFFTSLTTRSAYYALWPGKLGSEKHYQGASPELFSLYQTEVLNRSMRSLKLAFEIANAGLEYEKVRHGVQSGRTPKAIERLTRKEAFQDSAVRNMFRKVMAEKASKGGFSLRDYLELFSYSTDRGVSVSWSGWDLIRYYVGSIARESNFTLETLPEPHMNVTTPTYDRVCFFAYKVFERYVRERGVDRFKRDIIARAERNKFDIRWMRSQYSILATESNGFVYANYRDLCYSEDSKPTLGELVFQCRLLWSEWASQRSVIGVADPFEEVNDTDALVRQSNLPSDLARGLTTAFSEYVERRGMNRFERDVLRRLRDGEIGKLWYLKSLSTRIQDTGEGGGAGEQLVEFLDYSSDSSSLSERLFMLLLFLSNLYRIRSQSSAVV